MTPENGDNDPDESTLLTSQYSSIKNMNYQKNLKHKSNQTSSFNRIISHFQKNNLAYISVLLILILAIVGFLFIEQKDENTEKNIIELTKNIEETKIEEEQKKKEAERAAK